MMKKIVTFVTAVMVVLGVSPATAVFAAASIPNSSVAVGYAHTLAVKADGSLWAWGDNGYGQLGDGTFEDSAVPVKVMDSVKSVDAVGNVSLAVKTDGTFESREVPIEIMDGIKTPVLKEAVVPETPEAPLPLPLAVHEIVSDMYTVLINGQPVNLDVRDIDGSAYFNLRGLAEAIGADIDYDAATDTIVIQTK